MEEFMQKKIEGYLEYSNRASYSYTYDLNDAESIQKARKDIQEKNYENCDDFDQSSDGVGSSAFDMNGKEIDDYDDFVENDGELESEFNADEDETEYTWIYSDGSEEESYDREEALEMLAKFKGRRKKKLPVRLRVTECGWENDRSYGKFIIS